MQAQGYKSYQDAGIDPRDIIGKSGDVALRCPQCKKKDKSLSVNVEKQIWHCFKDGCGWRGFILKEKNEEKKKEYVLPQWTNNTAISDEIVKWFSSRGISQKILIDAKITGEKEINFNYFDEDQLIHIQYRELPKKFWASKNTELIFYNLNSIKEATCCIITEGQIDCLSFMEIGQTNVVSVPNGATISKGGLTYLDRDWRYFENKEKIYLATDQDEPGIKLRNELIRRLDAERCWIVDFGDCKDANEVLSKHGALVLEECFKNARQCPLEGVVFTEEIIPEIDRLYHEGLKPGAKIGMPEFDDLISFEPAYMTTITGIPNHGKGEVLDFIMLKLSLLHGWKFGIFSPENYPLELHVSKLAEKLIGKSFGGAFKMNVMEKDAAVSFIKDHFFFIMPKDEMFTLDNILQAAKGLVLRKGINSLIIDPWNRVEHHIPKGVNETNYISQQLDKITTYKQRHKNHVFIVAHPTKIKKDKTTMMFDVPNLYDISGSANFFNKTDNGITVYRTYSHDPQKASTTQVYVQKVKFKHWGKQGMIELKWNSINGRYQNLDADWDKSNWLHKSEQSQIDFNPMPQKLELWEQDEPPF